MNPLVKQFGTSPRWLNWDLRNGTKVPLGTSTDPTTWKPYKKLLPATAERGKGIVFTPDRLLLGIDIDHCLNPKTLALDHKEIEKIFDLILEADTYTEVSPSGTGLHLYLSLDKPFTPISNKKAPFELYTSGRFFTVTENSYKEPRDVRTVSEEELTRLLSIIGYPWGRTAPTINTFVSKPGTSSLSDEDVLERMFSSKHGSTIKELYEGNIAPYGGDESSADMALCNHLAFWTRGDHAQMERLWIASPLAKRDKTQNRSDYRNITIAKAISNCENFYTLSSSSDVIHNEEEEIELDLLHVMKKKEKIFTQCVENICRILRKHPYFQNRIRYDEFRNKLEYRPFKENQWRQFQDADVIQVQAQVSIAFEFFQKVSKDMVFDALMAVALENSYDSARDYISSLTWDKEPRLGTWLAAAYGTPKDAYHQAVGSNWLKGLVKRIVHPGCKFDFVLVLEGEQGVKKSTSLAVLGGAWHVETTMGTDNKDFFMQFQGKAIIEFSEGETLSRTEVKRMKAIISTQTDTYRPPYQRAMQDFPRRCVFAMTTNQEEYLKDETGNRRWLPVKVYKEEADLEWLKVNREQLFAEAYYRVVVLKESIYEFPLAETLAQQAARRVSDPNADAIADWYDSLTPTEKKAGVTADMVAKTVLHMGFTGSISRAEQMSIANVLREVLKLDREQTMVNGVRRYRYFPPNPLKGIEVKVAETEDHG